MKSIHIKHEGACRGIAIGRAHILSSIGGSFPKFWIADKEITSEIERFKNAILKSKQQLAKIKEKLCRFQGKDQIQIIDSHSMLLQDEMLVTHAIQNIANVKVNAEWALDKAISRLKMAFLDMKDDYFRQRKLDIDYTGQRIMKNLMGRPDISLHDVKEKHIIIVASDLSPADIVNFPRARVKGFITVAGGISSHSAIIARSLELPAMVGVEKALDLIKEGDLLVIDCAKGAILINPSNKELSEYKKRQRLFEEENAWFLKDAHLPAETCDGVRMSLVSNIEMVEEVIPSIQHGAEGIGLFRTEYLFLNRMDHPGEEEQFDSYKMVLEQMDGRPVTIRTLDIGGDKIFPGSHYAEHVNPALGLRAIRFCLVEREIFKTQLRALFRASPYGNLRMMIPMVSGLDEFHQARKIIDSVRSELKDKGIPTNPKVQLGIMIELPSAVMTAHSLAKEVDFFSIGTNDLIQYTLAVDRTNEHVSYLYNPLHPSIISMIKLTVDAAKANNIEVTVCGEAAGDPLYLLLFLGAGVNSLSMNPISIPRVKKMLRDVTAKEAGELFYKALNMTKTAEIEKLFKAEMTRHLKVFEQARPTKM